MTCASARARGTLQGLSRANVLPVWGIAAVAGLLAYDRRELGRVHPASLWVGVGLVVLNNLQFAVIGPSHAWRGLMAWLTR